MYTHEEATNASLEYFNGNELAANVFISKYALRNKEGELLEKTPTDMHWRLAKEFARIEKKKFKKPYTEEEIFEYLDKFERICVTSDNWVQTFDGARQVKDLIGKPFIAVVDNKLYRSTKEGFFKNGNKTIVKIQTKEGFELKTTKEHLISKFVKTDWYLRKKHTEYVEANSLKIGDKIQLTENVGNTWNGQGNYHEGWMLGFLVGDGTFNTISSAILYLCHDFKSDKETCVKIHNKIFGNNPQKIAKHYIRSNQLAKLAKTFGIIKGDKFNMSIIEKNASSDFCCGFIAGIFDADGHIYNVCKEAKGKDVSIRLSSFKYTLLQSIQRMLLRIGINSRIYKYRKPPGTTIIQGRSCTTKGYHDLRISKANIPVFVDIIGSLLEDKNNKLQKLININRKYIKERFYATVSKIIELDSEEVFDCTIEHVSCFDCNGVIVHNCPQGSIMSSCGDTYRYTTCSNCYTVPSPHDSYLGINYLDAQIAQISSRRGGVGWDMSTLRPNGNLVQNAAGSTTGVVSFMERFSNTIREVCQSGRRGASLQSLRVNHPDILDFIQCKNDDTSITGSNISVQFSNLFMESLDTKNKFELKWPTDSDTPKNSTLIEPDEIWGAFIENAWKRAEPGAMFMDTVHKHSTSAPYGKRYTEESANPCAEQFLPNYGKCLLMCVNLYTYVDNKFTDEATFNYTKFNKDVAIMQRLADDVVDIDIERMNNIIDKIKSDPEPDHIKQLGIDLWTNIRDLSISDRRTGCGIVALGDTLAALGLKYDSDQAIAKCDEIMKAFKLAAYSSSVDMAQELGPFEVYDYKLDKTSEFIQQLKKDDINLYNRMKKYGRRNMVLLTVAPTGTVSLLTNTTSGIEPVFMLKYTRRKKINPSENIKADFVDKMGDTWIEFEVNHRGLQDWMNVTNGTDPNDSPYYMSCSHEIDYLKKIDLQAVIQKHIDNSISVTTNLPADIDKQTVSDLYKKAWKLGCKGFTVYRDGCRAGVLVEKGTTEFPPERPRKLPCDVHHISIKGQQYFVLVGLLNDRPYEVFAGKNGFLPKKTSTGTIIRKRKGFYKAVFDGADEELSPITAATDEMEEVVTRLTSGLLRTGADMHFIVQQLEKVGGRQTEMYSFARSVARTLKKYIPDGTKDNEECPECGANSMIRCEGCSQCSNCGYSKCL